MEREGGRDSEGGVSLSLSLSLSLSKKKKKKYSSWVY